MVHEGNNFAIIEILNTILLHYPGPRLTRMLGQFYMDSMVMVFHHVFMFHPCHPSAPRVSSTQSLGALDGGHAKSHPSVRA